MIDVRVSPFGAWRPAQSCTYARRIAPRGTQAAPHERRTAAPAVLARRRLRKLLIQAQFTESPSRRSPPPASNAGATASFDFTHAAPYDRRTDMQYQRHATAEDHQRCRTGANAQFDCGWARNQTRSRAIDR